MRILIITQNDPFYLGRHLDYLLCKLTSFVTVCGVVVLDASPFGRAESFWKRIKRTCSVFGLKFFIRYSLRYIRSKIFDRNARIRNVIEKYNIEEIKLPKRSVNEKECLESFAAHSPDLIVSISANQIFGKNLLNLPTYGCLNLHTALLPKYKGLMPTFWALKNNEREIGISVFIMNEDIDTGEIIIQEKVPIDSQDSLESLINKTKRIGMDCILEATRLTKSRKYATIKVSPGQGHYYSFPNRKDVKEFIQAGKRFW